MEKLSPKQETSINWIIGRTPETRSKTRRLFEAVFQHQENIPGERAKSPEELAFIEQLNANLKKFVEPFSGSVIAIPSENIHVIDPKSPELQESRREPPVLTNMLKPRSIHFDRQFTSIIHPLLRRFNLR